MKMLIAIVGQRDARRLRDVLIGQEIRFTELGSTGGFLREGNATLMIVVEEDKVEDVLALISENCQKREQIANVAPPDTRLFAHPIGEGLPVTVGGAKIFVLNVEQSISL